MHRFVGSVLIALLLVSLASAQPVEMSTDQLRRMYDDAVAQLRAAQDRRNELARENERLQERVAGLQEQVADLKTQLTRLTDSTFQIRSERAAWLEFLRTSPVIRSQWFSFLHENRLRSEPSYLLDPQWPLRR